MKGLQQVGDNRYCVKVAVINRKGGTGKTTITANLAGELANRGYNVGAVDTDAQGGGHLGLCLGVAAADGLYRALVGEPVGRIAALEQVVAAVEPVRYSVGEGGGLPGNLFVLPAAEKTYRIPTDLDDASAFGRLLDEFAARFGLHIILIDTGPSMTLFDGSIYDAADCFLYVTQAETLSLVGVRDSFEQIARRNARRLRRGQQPSKVIGILPNLVGRLRSHSKNLNALGAAFGADMIWPPVRRLNAYTLMAERGQIVRAYTGGQVGEEMVALVDRFESEVATWLTS